MIMNSFGPSPILPTDRCDMPLAWATMACMRDGISHVVSRGGARDDAVLFLMKLFIFDSGPENGATRTSCGPGREGKHACTQSLSFVDPCGFHDFLGNEIFV